MPTEKVSGLLQTLLPWNKAIFHAHPSRLRTPLAISSLSRKKGIGTEFFHPPVRFWLPNLSYLPVISTQCTATTNSSWQLALRLHEHVTWFFSHYKTAFSTSWFDLQEAQLYIFYRLLWFSCLYPSSSMISSCPTKHDTINFVHCLVFWFKVQSQLLLELG